MNKNNLILILLLSILQVSAQNPAPALPQQEAILIMNGTAHIGNGKIIENSVIGIKQGKIVLIGDATVLKFRKDEYPVVIDAFGKHVYPGFINCNSTLGLTEIDLVRATRDFGEVGEMNPNVRSLIAYNTDSKIIPTVRSNGVLMAQIVPEGKILSGQSSIVQLDAWNWEDAAYKKDDGIHLNWPRMYVIPNHPKESEDVQRQKIQANLDELERFFNEARAYCKSQPKEENLRFEAMRGLFDGSKNLFVHCDYIKEIVSSINFAKKLGLKMVLVGGSDSYLVTDLLKTNDIPVILGRTHSLPGRDDDDFDIAYRLPYILNQAGIRFALSVEGSWASRNLMFNAGSAVAFGLPGEEAIKAITLAPAEILGISVNAGSLETGKDATLFISDGDALDMRTNNIIRAFIQGRDIDLDNVQSQLYRKYMKKYGLIDLIK